MQKTMLLKQREMAEQVGDQDEISKFSQELEDLEYRAKSLDKRRQENIAGKLNGTVVVVLKKLFKVLWSENELIS